MIDSAEMRVVKFLKKLRALNVCQRWNYHPRIRHENVAEHSYWVVVFAHQFGLMSGLDDAEMRDLMVAAAYHDRLEAITGDLPAPVKRGRTWEEVERDADREMDMPKVWVAPDLSSKLQRILKAADLMSAAAFAQEEMNLGNEGFRQIRNELIKALYNHLDTRMADFATAWGLLRGWGEDPIKDMSHL